MLWIVEGGGQSSLVSMFSKRRKELEGACTGTWLSHDAISGPKIIRHHRKHQNKTPPEGGGFFVRPIGQHGRQLAYLLRRCCLLAALATARLGARVK